MWTRARFRGFCFALLLSSLSNHLIFAYQSENPSKLQRIGRELCAGAARVLGKLSRADSGKPTTRRRISMAANLQEEALMATGDINALALMYKMDAQGLLADDQSYLLSIDPFEVNALIDEKDFFSLSGILANVEVTGYVEPDFYRYLAERPIKWEALLDLIDQSFNPDQNSVVPQIMALDDFERIFEMALQGSLAEKWRVQIGDSFWVRTQKSARRIQYEMNRNRWQNLLDRALFVGSRLEFARKFMRELQNLTPALSGTQEPKKLSD